MGRSVTGWPAWVCLDRSSAKESKPTEEDRDGVPSGGVFVTPGPLRALDPSSSAKVAHVAGETRSGRLALELHLRPRPFRPCRGRIDTCNALRHAGQGRSRGR